MSKQIYIGVDIGGTKISAALVNQEGKIFFKEKIPSPDHSRPKDNLKVIIELIKLILREEDLKPKAVEGIGLGVPGIVSTDNSTIVTTPNMHLSGVSLSDELKKVFKIPVVTGNDVNFGLLGEHWLGAAHGVKNVIGLFPGTGIGGAIIMNGKLYLGTHGAAAELGHMIVELDGPKCTCGNRGCLEAFAGRWAIERDIKWRIKLGAKTILTRLCDGDLSQIKSKSIKKALEKRDPLTLKVMNQVALNLGKGCISLKHIFDPEMIVLGGGLIEACGGYILPVIQKTCNEDPLFKKISRCPIVPSQLGDDAVMLGAVFFLKQSLRKKGR